MGLGAQFCITELQLAVYIKVGIEDFRSRPHEPKRIGADGLRTLKDLEASLEYKGAGRCPRNEELTRIVVAHIAQDVYRAGVLEGASYAIYPGALAPEDTTWLQTQRHAGVHSQGLRPKQLSAYPNEQQVPHSEAGE